MKRFAILTALAVLFSVASLAQAHCGQCETDKTQASSHDADHGQATVATIAAQADAKSTADCAACPAEKKAASDCASCPADKKAAGDCASCPADKAAKVDAAVSQMMPKMSYKVGEQTFADYHAAKAAAAEAGEGAVMQFVVGEHVYADKLEAKAALAEATEAKVLAMIEAHPQAQEAVAATFASYKVGDKEICCEKMATMAAEKDGQPMHYLVAGQETACPVTARLLTAQAKLRAAAQAVAMGGETAEAQPTAEPAAAIDQPATGS